MGYIREPFRNNYKKFCSFNVKILVKKFSTQYIKIHERMLKSYIEMSQTMSTATLNFLENLELKNNRTYMEYLVLLKN